MARIYKCVCFMSLFLISFFGVKTPRAMAQYEDANVSYNDFYNDLSLYGQWIDDPKYGYVWSPDEDGSFRPYFSNGYWVMTDYGNTWISNYPWGWACFHYGRWTYDNYYGWLWVPGSNWGPSWVTWRYNDGYYGWAPLGPDYEVTVNMSNYSCPNDWWTFIPSQYIYSGSYYRYWSGPRSNSTLIPRTTIINNVYVNNNTQYVSGPHLHQVQQVSKQPVQIYKITNSTSLNTRVRNNNVKMYRPAEIRPLASSNGRRVPPPNVVTAPQPVRMSQTINLDQTTRPQFRSELPRNNNQTFPAGTRVAETAAPEQRQRQRDNRPYEWDVNQTVPQPVRERTEPQQQQARSTQQPQQSTPRGQQAPAQTPRGQAPAQQSSQQPQPRQGAGRR
jgi:hypothetical protein